MAEMNDMKRNKNLELVETVDALSEETKDLALNLALYLAKAKARGNAERLNRLEPEFVRLVNGAVKVVQELTVILNAAKDQEKMIYELPTGQPVKDHIEARLESIVQQCNRIMAELAGLRDIVI